MGYADRKEITIPFRLGMVAFCKSNMPFLCDEGLSGVILLFCPVLYCRAKAATATRVVVSSSRLSQSMCSVQISLGASHPRSPRSTISVAERCQP